MGSPPRLPNGIQGSSCGLAASEARLPGDIPALRSSWASFLLGIASLCFKIKKKAVPWASEILPALASVAVRCCEGCGHGAQASAPS